ncbi:UPF0389 protein GA21628 isoform X2 [Lucilia sericata]|uniref:UPF0389 protein GA21628 isoform X2 n=1 Tax=Lucilia sericata TaxID=13632 RepID=UPI0018A858C0|nr:UPF0389 protein GA21628 isoform X2 [Lucilia sericata]
MFKQIALVPSLLARRAMSQSSAPGQVNSYTPNNLEKRFLVWTGKFKSVHEVPNFVSAEVMERSRNKMRIRIANIMMGLTILGCALMIYSGKAAAKRGDSVTKQNLEWHKRYNELNATKETKE